MKKYEKDLAFIRSKFDETPVQAPESLSEEAMLQKLQRAESGSGVVKLNGNRPKKRAFKTAAALVACFAVAAVSLFTADKVIHKDIYIPTPSTATVNIAGVHHFDSYEELEKELKAIDKRQTYSVTAIADGIMKGESPTLAKNAAEDAEMPADNAIAYAGERTAEESETSFAATNKQVDAVDEADIIKTDGQYIYYLSTAGNCVIIYAVDNGKTERVARIALNDSRDDINESFCEMFLIGNKLLVIGNHYEYNDYIVYGDEETDDQTVTKAAEEIAQEVSPKQYVFLCTYDVSDPAEPEKVGEYRQSGNYVSSRMLGSVVYLISDYGSYYYGYDVVKNESVPYATGADGVVTKLPIENISALDDCRNSTYSVIGAVDTAGKRQTSETKALLGASDNVYCNEKNLYLTGLTYHKGSEYTQIVKYAVDGTSIKEKCAVELKGNLNDQFSLDEYRGNLRVAITEYNWETADGNRNYLYVFDKDLKQIGKLDSFAAGEHIEAVRFMGDIAYVITYETTDPLFIMDLSDPTNPVMNGEVKIDGFSTFLTPVDDNTMLGIGYATKQEEWGIVRDGLKLALFDVSDKTKPRVLDAIEYHSAESAAQYTHKAIVKNAEKGYFAIPFYQYDGYDRKSGNANGALVIRIDGQDLATESLAADCYAERCTYVGDYVYVLSENGFNIYSFEVK